MTWTMKRCKVTLTAQITARQPFNCDNVFNNTYIFIFIIAIMKMKLTTLMFGLLLAVGWTSHASAQALPQGGYAERLGLNDVTATMSVKDIVKAHKKKVALPQAMPMSIQENTTETTVMRAPMKAPIREVSDVVKPKSYYQQFKYSWTDEDTHETFTNVDPTEPATNPYQIYELLRFVYGNPNFPGPTYNAYLPTLEREDEVSYDAITRGGWDITVGSGTASATTHDITITTSSWYPTITSITVYGNNNSVLASWDAATAINNGDYSYGYDSDNNRVYYFNFPSDWTKDFDYFMYWNLGTTDNPIHAGYTGSGVSTPGTITIPYTVLNGQTDNVRVVINASHDWEEGDEGSETQTITVNGVAKTLTSDLADYTWDNIVVYEAPQEGAFVQGTVIPPFEDGYTVLVVALNDNGNIVDENGSYSSSYFTTKAQLISYIRDNIEFVKLLTDGLRVGENTATVHTSGTIFNCDGRYNKFFFLSKGQARKKAPYVTNYIAQDPNNRYMMGEDVPFKEMFEQLSPTTTKLNDETNQTFDFFDKMREGNLYSLKHDCPSVIQTGHQFSLTGNANTEHFAFSGLNLFIPDYRLLWWDGTGSGNDTSYPNQFVDGRDADPYQTTDASTGKHGSNYRTPSANNYYMWSAYYANYNPTYAPKIGIYRITLDAKATQVADSHDPNNLNFDVTLTWVSSLNQMSGSIVPQVYTVYLVDENGNRTELHPESVTFYDINGNEMTGDYSDNPFVVTQVVYKVPQNEHSYTIEYQVEGVAQQGPGFHATSNRASVVIPGWNDFVGLKLDHHESDFIITSETVRDNYYRNFLAMVNEDIFNGLTISKITGYDGETPMNKFNLYRFIYNDQGQAVAETKVATITFDQATADQVHYTITYENQEIEDYTLSYKDGNQTITVPNAYTLENLDVPTSGWVRVKGNGDIVIWPNRYSVNIKSITVKNGNTTITSWNASSASFANQDPNLPTTPYKWATSPGSKFLPYTTTTNGEKVCYMEGGGYLYIPGILRDYPNATIVIEAFGEAGNVNRISVNDDSKDINAVAGGTTYTWGGSNDPVSPNAAPKRDNNGSRKDVKDNTSTNKIQIR